MNTNKENLTCTKCNTIIYTQHMKFCPNCGNTLNNIIQKNKSYITFFILSIINILIIVPTIFKFSLLWLLLGALTNNNFLYYGILLCCCGYILASIVGLISFIINFIKKGKIIKKCLLAIFISFCLGIIIPIIIYKYNYNISKPKINNQNLTENKLIL